MVQVKIISPSFEKTVLAEKGEQLLKVLAACGVSVPAPCGGRGVCGKCLVRVEGSIEKRKPAPKGYALACESFLTEDITVFPEEERASILADFDSGNLLTDGEAGLGVAVDIGTTTLAAYLMSLENGKVLSSATMLNPQRIHGADVVSRIDFATQSPENAHFLKTEIENALDSLTKTLLEKSSLQGESIKRYQLVGNTAMMHLAGGYDTLGISRAPFTPAYTKAHEKPVLGVKGYWGGCISGYVGADTLACMLACGFDREKRTCLLIDIGTNGEIALLKNGKIRTCSCAAGPAFEGAHIACGIGAVDGAIDHAHMENGRIVYSTIGNQKAIGICGSGLIDLTACLFEEEEISPMGRMAENRTICENVYLAREDIREVQLAKSAIASGVEVLMKEADVTYGDIDVVYLAGGFGNFISIPSACAIGLISAELMDKIRPVGNAAGEGARLLLISNEMRMRAERIHAQSSYIELASHPDFPDLYAEHLLFGDEE